MTQHRVSRFRPSLVFVTLLIVSIFGKTSGVAAEEPTPTAISGFNAYIGSVESRLALQHESKNTTLASVALNPQNDARLHQGELIIERLTPSRNSVGSEAMLHHWRGTAFAPGAKASDFEHLMKDFDAYPRHFSPQVVQARLLVQKGDHLQASMRVRQKHVITVVMDTTYDVTFERLDAQRGYTLSRSTKISEVDSPGTASERELSPSEEHGFLWRLNTYWSYEEREGGLYMQIESVSLTRSIPRVVDWAVRPFVESVPRESLEFTLRSVCKAVRK